MFMYTRVLPEENLDKGFDFDHQYGMNFYVFWMGSHTVMAIP